MNVCISLASKSINTDVNIKVTQCEKKDKFSFSNLFTGIVYFITNPVMDAGMYFIHE